MAQLLKKRALVVNDCQLTYYDDVAWRMSCQRTFKARE